MTPHCPSPRAVSVARDVVGGDDRDHVSPDNEYHLRHPERRQREPRERGELRRRRRRVAADHGQDASEVLDVGVVVRDFVRDSDRENSRSELANARQQAGRSTPEISDSHSTSERDAEQREPRQIQADADRRPDTERIPNGERERLVLRRTRESVKTHSVYGRDGERRERDVPVWTVPSVARLDDDDGLEVLVRYGDGRVVALDDEQ